MNLFLSCAGFSSLHLLSLVVMSGGYSVVAVCRLLIAVASLVAEHRLKGSRAQRLQFSDSSAQAQ